MTARQEKGIELIHKIVMWFAMVCLIGISGYIFSTMKTQALEIEKIKCANAEQTTEIAVLKTNYTNIDKNLSDILSQVKKNNDKLDNHMIKDSK